LSASRQVGSTCAARVRLGRTFVLRSAAKALVHLSVHLPDIPPPGNPASKSETPTPGRRGAVESHPCPASTLLGLRRAIVRAPPREASSSEMHLGSRNTNSHSQTQRTSAVSRRGFTHRSSSDWTLVPEFPIFPEWRAQGKERRGENNMSHLQPQPLVRIINFRQRSTFGRGGAGSLSGAGPQRNSSPRGPRARRLLVCLALDLSSPMSSSRFALLASLPWTNTLHASQSFPFFQLVVISGVTPVRERYV